MKRKHACVAALLISIALAAVPASAHHGSSISYNTGSLWTTWANVVQFNYMNPHPTMVFERKVANGQVERWVSELLTNPSMMARQGWTKQKTEQGLTAGTRVKLTLATSRAGGFSGIIMVIESESGEKFGSALTPVPAVDLDGVAGGLQPKGEINLPGQDSH